MFQTERHCHSKVMKSASNEHDQIVKTKLAASESIFDNTTFLNSPDGMFHKNPGTQYFPVFLFQVIRQFLAFGLLCGHLHGYVFRGMPQESRILPQGNSRWQGQWLTVHYFLVVNMSLVSPRQPENAFIRRTDQVILHAMRFFSAVA